MPVGPLRVVGLSELLKALNAIGPELSAELRGRLREAAAVVSEDAATRLAGLNPSPAKSAAGIIPRVRAAGLVTVEQKLRRTTGKRPDWGATQMRDAFLPAADADAEVVAQMLEKAIDDVALRHGF